MPACQRGGQIELAEIGGDGRRQREPPTGGAGPELTARAPALVDGRSNLVLGGQVGSDPVQECRRGVVPPQGPCVAAAETSGDAVVVDRIGSGDKAVEPGSAVRA